MLSHVDLNRQATELARDTILEGNPIKVPQMIARLLYWKEYDLPIHAPLIDNNDRVVRFCLEIDKENFDPDMPPEADVVVFVRDEEMVGWLPKEQADQVPKRFAGLSADYLFSMPVDCDFKVHCRKIPCQNSAVWDYYAEAWDCFACPRFNFDERTRRYVESDRVTPEGN